MTEALAPLFEGKQIRALEKDGEVWLPLTDLAAAWGTDASNPYHIIERNPEIFEGMTRMSCDIDVTATSGRCVNERGLYLLIGKISAGRLKNPEAKAAIIRFQRWVPELIQRYRKREIVQVSTGPDLDTEIKRARIIAEKCGKNPDAFLAIALEKCGEMDYIKALNSPAIIHGEPGWHNITQLVALCNDPLLNPERLNPYLNNRGYQYRDENRLWRLTPAGMEHGKEYLYTSPHQHSETRISWRESVLYASGLKRPMPESQTALSAKV